MNYGNVHNFTSLTHAAVNVQNTSTAALAINPDRAYALFQNISNEAIYLKFDAVANASQGIYVAANGGEYEMSPAKANLCQSAVTAVATNSGKLLLVSYA